MKYTGDIGGTRTRRRIRSTDAATGEIILYIRARGSSRAGKLAGSVTSRKSFGIPVAASDSKSFALGSRERCFSPGSVRSQNGPKREAGPRSTAPRACCSFTHTSTSTTKSKRNTSFSRVYHKGWRYRRQLLSRETTSTKENGMYFFVSTYI